MTKRKDNAIRGRPKGSGGKYRSNEERILLVHNWEKSNIPVCTFARQNNIPRGTFGGWVAKYLKNGDEGLKSKTGKCGSGNPYSALYIKKNLNEVEKLKLELAKKEVECERLKKGYSVKGVGRRKEFVTINKKNSK